ncbi:PhzF family phenazine biosynthesis protein [Streptomyces filamentosus]|uniref:PhzF family phenazine biosynthesis protein n=1 Tax=Streptomyces filamentosus TaxID=67294 RepID=UPI0033E91D76
MNRPAALVRTATLVRACVRAGDGGSPTAVLDEPAPGRAPLTDAERRRIPALAGTSHAVFVGPAPHGPGHALRFFTATGELPACGHGTLAALSHLAARTRTGTLATRLHAGGRVFAGHAAPDPGGPGFRAAFDPGPVTLRDPAPAAYDLVLPALGLRPPVPGRIASVGRPRLLLPVRDRAELAALAPDFARLRAACDALGLLGVHVHTAPGPGDRTAVRLAARMFAPSIGVDEDVANANSVACLAAHLADGRPLDLAVDTGDSLGAPATLTATARPGPEGPAVTLGGTAILGRA